MFKRKNQLDKIFAPRSETTLTSDEKSLIADLLIEHPAIWEAVKKYFYHKANSVSRQMANCDKEQLAELQRSLKQCMEPIYEFEKIKKLHLQEKRASAIVKPVKDLFFYVQGKDLMSKSGQRKLKPSRL